MRVLLIAVGRARGDPAAAAADDYLRRLAWPVEVREVEIRRKAANPAEQKRQEADQLLAAAADASVMVALDSRGTMLSSEAFADRIRRWRDGGSCQVAFVIGGAEGLDGGVLKRADLVISLGPMTWPHLLVRSMLAEQLYRAQQIIAGHPYHRA